MQNFLPRVRGNERLRARLGAELAANSFSHAYLIAGPHGCGKRTLALEVAMAAACEHRDAPTLPCGKCEACRKIREGISPDVITVKKPTGKNSIGVESIRFLREDIHTVPNDLDIKIYIIEDAHTMTVQAQNAFLLTLEEPPPFVLFFLLTEDTDALLETVRSRAQTLRMLPLSEESIAQHLLHTAPADVISAATKLKESEPDQFAAIVKMAGGAIGVAIELLDPARREPLLERRAHVIACCRALAARNRENLARELLAIGTVREEVASILREWQLALRDLLVLSGTENAPLLFFTDRDEALTLGERFTAVRLFDIEAALSAALLSLSLNANVRLCLVQLQNSLLAAGTPQKQKGNSPFLTQ